MHHLRSHSQTFALLGAVLLLLACTRSWDEHGPVVVAEKGRVLVPVVVSPSAIAETRETAADLARLLSAITGATFSVTESADLTAGISLGLPGDFSDLKVYSLPYWDALGPDAATHIVAWSNGKNVSLSGSTNQSLRNAMWELLHTIGYRKYAPYDAWEVIPKKPRLVIDVAVKRTPRFQSRRIFFGFGQWPDNTAAYQDWLDKNQMLGGDPVSIGHVWQGIIKARQAEFDTHPEWLGRIDGSPSNKFCVMAPGLSELVVDWVLETLRADPSRRYISMEPSDGGGWDGCESDAGMSPSDRVVTLANAVAAGIEDEFPGRFITFYAYSQHSPPPTIVVRPEVIVFPATSFAKGEFSDLVRGWAACPGPCTQNFGIRDYLNLYNSSRDLPGRAQIMLPFETLPKIDRYAELGVNLYLAESTDAWGPAGPTYWMVARALSAEAGTKTDVPEQIEDFIINAFAGINEMRNFYGLLLTREAQLMSSHTLGILYGYLNDSMSSTLATESVRRRIRELVLYLRYIELWRQYWYSKGAERQENFETLIRYVYRIRGHELVHSLGLYRSPYDASVNFPEGAEWNVPEPDNPWKDSSPVTDAEIDAILRAGVSNNPTLAITKRTFSWTLVPADVPTPSSGPPYYNYLRLAQRWYTWVDSPSERISFDAKLGVISQAPLHVELLHLEADGSVELETSIEVTPIEGGVSTFHLTTTKTGLHLLKMNDGRSGFRLDWPHPGRPLIAEASLPSSEYFFPFAHRHSAFFYVPKSTTQISGWMLGHGQLRDSLGNIQYEPPSRPEHFLVPVPEDQQGKVWRCQMCVGRIVLLNIPPYVAVHPGEFLLPESIVEADDLHP